jgi:endonuclease/exonuclease/phosphatase family metal-dependent hydrolase
MAAPGPVHHRESTAVARSRRRVTVHADGNAAIDSSTQFSSSIPSGTSIPMSILSHSTQYDIESGSITTTTTTTAAAAAAAAATTTAATATIPVTGAARTVPNIVVKKEVKGHAIKSATVSFVRRFCCIFSGIVAMCIFILLLHFVALLILPRKSPTVSLSTSGTSDPATTTATAPETTTTTTATTPETTATTTATTAPLQTDDSLSTRTARLQEPEIVVSGSSDKPTSIRIVSFNLWNNMFRWPVRKDFMAQMIQESNADVVALQEVVKYMQYAFFEPAGTMYHQMYELLELLPDFQYFAYIPETNLAGALETHNTINLEKAISGEINWKKGIPAKQRRAGNPLLWEEGLAILSRYPLEDISFRRFDPPPKLPKKVKATLPKKHNNNNNNNSNKKSSAHQRPQRVPSAHGRKLLGVKQKPTPKGKTKKPKKKQTQPYDKIPRVALHARVLVPVTAAAADESESVAMDLFITHLSYDKRLQCRQAVELSNFAAETSSKESLRVLTGDLNVYNDYEWPITVFGLEVNKKTLTDPANTNHTNPCIAARADLVDAAHVYTDAAASNPVFTFSNLPSPGLESRPDRLLASSSLSQWEIGKMHAMTTSGGSEYLAAYYWQVLLRRLHIVTAAVDAIRKAADDPDADKRLKRVKLSCQHFCAPHAFCICGVCVSKNANFTQTVPPSAQHHEDAVVYKSEFERVAKTLADFPTIRKMPPTCARMGKPSLESFRRVVESAIKEEFFPSDHTMLTVDIPLIKTK